MGFHNGYEIKKFERKWNGLRKEYADAGMDEEAIAQMYDFDKSAFLSNRRFYEKVILCHDYHKGNDNHDGSNMKMNGSFFGITWKILLPKYLM